MSYIPVGLGDKKFSNECFNDKKGENISHKNNFMGSIPFITGYGKITCRKLKQNGLVFVNIENFCSKN